MLRLKLNSSSHTTMRETLKYERIVQGHDQMHFTNINVQGRNVTITVSLGKGVFFLKKKSRCQPSGSLFLKNQTEA